MAQDRPEGTDSIIAGAGVDADDERDLAALDAAVGDEPRPAGPAHGDVADQAAAVADGVGQAAAEEAQSFTARVEGLRGQANDWARDYAEQAKGRASAGLDDMVRLINDAAAEVDDKIGQQFGDYVRRASAGIAGVSDALKGRDVDALFADAGNLVRQAPGVAVGAAAAIGFVVARLARAGLGDLPGGDGSKHPQ